MHLGHQVVHREVPVQAAELAAAPKQLLVGVEVPPGAPRRVGDGQRHGTDEPRASRLRAGRAGGAGRERQVHRANRSHEALEAMSVLVARANDM